MIIIIHSENDYDGKIMAGNYERIVINGWIICFRSTFNSFLDILKFIEFNIAEHTLVLHTISIIFIDVLLTTNNTIRSEQIRIIQVSIGKYESHKTIYEFDFFLYI